jgi:transcriptional regulator with XRE-family HTH domain
MTIDEFLHLSYRQLQAKTNIDKSNWSKYFNEHISPSWKTLKKAANSLNMQPYELEVSQED